MIRIRLSLAAREQRHVRVDCQPTTVRAVGPEGLRGLCIPKSVAEDSVPWLMKSSIPPPWCVPLPEIAFPFGTSLITMFYGPGIVYQARFVRSRLCSCLTCPLSHVPQVKGLFCLAACFIMPGLMMKKKRVKQE